MGLFKIFKTSSSSASIHSTATSSSNRKKKGEPIPPSPSPSTTSSKFLQPPTPLVGSNRSTASRLRPSSPLIGRERSESVVSSTSGWAPSMAGVSGWGSGLREGNGKLEVPKAAQPAQRREPKSGGEKEAGGYRIPSLHLEEEDDSWGLFGDLGVGEKGVGAGARAGDKVGLGIGSSEPKTTSPTSSLPPTPPPKMDERPDDDDDDETPLGMLARRPAASTSKPSFTSGPIAPSPSLDMPALPTTLSSPPTSTTPLSLPPIPSDLPYSSRSPTPVDTRPASPSQSLAGPPTHSFSRARKPSAASVAGTSGGLAKRRSSFFGLRGLGSKTDLRLGPPEAERATRPKSSLDLSSFAAPDRGKLFGGGGLETESEPQTPAERSSSALGMHRRNGSAGSFAPPSAWKASAPSPSMAVSSSSTSSNTGSGFPWLSSTKSRDNSSATPALTSNSGTSPYGNPSMSVSSTSLSLAGLLKGKGKSKEKKDSPMLDGEDPSFKLRSFRHVSSASASDIPPWEMYTNLEPPKAVSPPAQTLSPPLPPLSESSTRPISPQPSVSPHRGGASRRSSMYSLAEEPARQIPAGVFKQRRMSGSGQFGPARLELVSGGNEDQKLQITPTRSEHQHTDGQEVLKTPVKLTLDEVLTPRPGDQFSSRSSSALSNHTESGRPGFARSRSASAVETLTDLQESNSSTSNTTIREPHVPSVHTLRNQTSARKGFVVASRRSASISSTGSLLLGESSRPGSRAGSRPGSALGNYSAVPPETVTARSPPIGNVGPRPASVMSFSTPVFPRLFSTEPEQVLEIPPAPEDDLPLIDSPVSMGSTMPPSPLDGDGFRVPSIPSRKSSVSPVVPTPARSATSESSRMTLSERLAYVAAVAANGQQQPLSPPPKPSTDRTLSEPPPRKVSVKRRQGSTTSSGGGNKKSGTWDLSSSDENESKSAKSSIRAPAHHPRTESMPSGIRRPPPPSVAFGDSVKAVGYVPLKGPADGPAKPFARSAVPRSQSSFEVGKRASQARLAPSSDSDEDTEEESSEDESLSAIRSKKSNGSLASSFRAGHSQAGSREPSRSESTDRARPTAPSKLRHSSSSNNVGQSSMARPRSTLAPIPAQSPTHYSSRSPSLPRLATDRSREPSVAAFPLVRPRHSPASSQSGTGDTSSSGVPVTPMDLNSSSSDIAVVMPHSRAASSERGGARSILEGSNGRARGRRVSFMNDEPLDPRLEIERLEKKRKERRRDETRAAMDLGDALNRPEPARQMSAGGSRETYNPYLNGAPAAQMASQPHVQQQQQNFQPQMPQMPQYDAQVMQQQQQLYAMQMAQMNPTFMHIHQQAMAFAKQQYQASIAAAAMQAANDEWERSSNVSGFNPVGMMGMNPYQGSQMGFAPSVMGMSQPAMSVYGGGSVHGGGSVYGGSSNNLQQFSSASSVHGGMFAPPESRGIPRAASSSRLADVRGGTQSATSSPRRQRMASERGSMLGPIS